MTFSGGCFPNKKKSRVRSASNLTFRLQNKRFIPLIKKVTFNEKETRIVIYFKFILPIMINTDPKSNFCHHVFFNDKKSLYVTQSRNECNVLFWSISEASVPSFYKKRFLISKNHQVVHNVALGEITEKCATNTTFWVFSTESQSVKHSADLLYVQKIKNKYCFGTCNENNTKNCGWNKTYQQKANCWWCWFQISVSPSPKLSDV